VAQCRTELSIKVGLMIIVCVVIASKPAYAADSKTSFAQTPKSAKGKQCAREVARCAPGGRDSMGRTRDQIWAACLGR